MIKVETLGMLDIAKINPVLKSEQDVKNYSFITDNGITYLVSNTLSGDDAGRDDTIIPAGEYLNGYDLTAFKGQNLVVDEKHIAYGNGVANYEALGTSNILGIDDDKLSVLSNRPETGMYFVVVGKCTLTEKAVKVKVMAD